jgi:predicted AlkP superfamily pyrophosphatase or phosphodiesterase
VSRVPQLTVRLAVALLVTLIGAVSGCRHAGAPGAATTAPSRAARTDTPTLILLSLDGWRWDYHTKAPTPNLQRLMARGVRAERLIPVYPTKTFPNHYTIVTGLYPEHHGIVANTMREPGTSLRFALGDRDAVEDGRWWSGEPIWVTAVRQGRRTATLFWPGSEAPIGGVRPDEWIRYDGAISNAERVARILAWLDLPPATRPSFITGYFNDTDDAGHAEGPDSVAVRDAIVRLDETIGLLIAGLESRQLVDRVNLVVVSDHGMAEVSADRAIALSDYVDPSSVDVIDLDAHLGLNMRTASVDDVHRRLVRAHPRLHVYRRNETPAHWHYRGHPRIPAIVGVMDEGWTIVRERGNIARVLNDRGNHGFDPRVRSMHGIFVAAGPAFRHGVVVPAFENVHIYNALAAALRVSPAANDGDPSVARRLLAGS